jgi:hypothetical protein
MLVSATIMVIVFSMVFTAFIQTRKISDRNQRDAEILQNARIGVDEIARTLRMIGYRRDTVQGQVALIEAAPFQIIFNANLDQDEPLSKQKKALPPGTFINLYDATIYTTPMQDYATEAETIHWTLDSGGDGIVDKNDINDDEEEQSTAHNPNDMVLVKRVNKRRVQQVTLGVLGPYDAHDQPTYVPPLFQYWLVSENGTFSLLGDEDDNGKLEGHELYFRSITSQTILSKIRRILVTITTESDGKDPFDRTKHRRVSLGSKVSLRNME